MSLQYAVSRHSVGSHCTPGGVTPPLGINDRGVIQPGESLIPLTPELLGGGSERGYISLARLPQQLLEQHALLSLMSWAYSTCAVFALLFQQRAGSGVTLNSTFLFEACSLFVWVTSRT